MSVTFHFLRWLVQPSRLRATSQSFRSIRNDSSDGQDIRWNGENVPAIDWLAR